MDWYLSSFCFSLLQTGLADDNRMAWLSRRSSVCHAHGSVFRETLNDQHHLPPSPGVWLISLKAAGYFADSVTVTACEVHAEESPEGTLHAEARQPRVGCP